MDILTSHSAVHFGVERGIVESLSFYVDGIAMVGPRGQRLDDALADSYRREVDAILADLDRLAAAMIEVDARRGASDAVTLAERLAGIVESLAAVQAEQQRTSGVFTADFRNGGRPITGETETVPEPPSLTADLADLVDPPEPWEPQDGTGGPSPAADGSDGDGSDDVPAPPAKTGRKR